MIHKILYPTDFSKASQAALPLLRDLAKRYGAQVHVIHAVDLHSEFLMEGGYMVPLLVTYPIEQKQLQESAEKRLGEFVREHLPDLQDSVQKAVVLGKPFVEIVRYADEQGIDLIVIGTHGHSALASVLLGGVAEKVVHKAHCAVLTVRHPEPRSDES
jgi:nucleotide-binding universal stress UspA family protein